MADFGHPGAGAVGGHGHFRMGTMLNEQGTVMTQAEVKTYCEKKGLCTTCGVTKTHKISGILRKPQKIVEGPNVRNGICLNCNPHLREDYGVQTASISTAAHVAVAAHRFRDGAHGHGHGPSHGGPSHGPSHGHLGGGGGHNHVERAPSPPRSGGGGGRGVSNEGSVGSGSAGDGGGGVRRNWGARAGVVGRGPLESAAPPSSSADVGSASDQSGGSGGGPAAGSRMTSSLTGLGAPNDGGAGGGAGGVSSPPDRGEKKEDDLDEEYGWAPGRNRSSTDRNGRPLSLMRHDSHGDAKDAWDVVKTMRDFPNDRPLLSRQLHRLRAIGKNEAGSLYEVIDVMNRHPRDARLQAAACGAIWGVTALEDDRKVEAVDSGAVEAVVRAMRSLPGDARLATWGLGTLACLAHGTGNRATMVEQGALDAVVSALMAHPRDSGVFEWAARALYGLVEAHVPSGLDDSRAGNVDAADGEDEMREEIADTRKIVVEFRSSARLLPGLLRAMQFHPLSFVAQEWSFRFLWVLLTTNTAANAGADELGGGPDEADPHWKDVEPTRSLLRSISDEGGPKVCMDVIRSRPTTERLQEMAFALLCSVVDQSSWVRSDNADRVESVIELMKEYPHNAWIQEEACDLLSVWASAEDDRRTVLAGMGGLTAVLAAMDNHPSTLPLQKSAMHILWTLSSSRSLWSGDPDLLRRVVGKTVSSLTSQSLSGTTTADSATIQERALGVLSNLILIDGARGGNDGGDSAATQLVDTVVSVLLSHSSDPHLVQRACLVLSNSCVDDPLGRIAGAIVDSGGVRAVVRSMVACSDARGAQEEGLSALCGVLSSSQDEHRAAVIEGGGIEAIRDAMAGHPDSLTVQLRGTYAICTVTLCKRADQSVVREGVVSALAQAVSGPHRDSNELLTRSCLALRNFALAAASTGRTRREAAFPSPGEVMECVLNVLKRKGDNLILQKEACGALFALSALCTDTESIPLNPVFREMVRILEYNKGDEVQPFNKAILGEALGTLENLTGLSVREGNASAGGFGRSGIIADLQDIDVIIAVMYEAGLGEENPDPDIVDGVFGVLLNLSHDKVFEDAVIQCGGIVSIIDAMQMNEGNESIESKGCAILSRLSADNLEVKYCIAETDGVEVIISAMLHNPSTAPLQVQACRTLAHLTIDEESRALITQQGGIVLILQAMSNHPDDPELQETACEALCGLACDAHESVLSESNVVGAVIETMRLHVDSPRVQERALGILQNLSMRSAASKVAIASAHGIEMIVASIRENMTCAEVLERAFTALWSLAVLDGNQERIVAADGISILVNAMMASISFLAVQKQACGCLCTLSSDPKCKRLIKEHGGMDAIVFAMWAHLNSETLLVEACRALSSLAVLSDVHGADGPDDANEGVVDAVILCMRRFPDSVKLQEIACLALRNLSLSPSFLRLMKQRAEDLEKLLHKAAAKFPGECSQRANQVLTQLFDG